MLISFIPTAQIVLGEVLTYIRSRKIAFTLALLGCFSVTLGFGLLIRTASYRPPEVSAADVPQEVRWQMVDVGGAVVQPGVYQLAAGERWSRAVQLAGGILPQADPLFVARQLNLAEEAKDGGKLYIPFASEASSISTLGGEVPLDLPATNGISINTASIAELDTLPGIGAKRAEDIIQNRPYTSLNDLLERKILTQSIFDDLEGLISL